MPTRSECQKYAPELHYLYREDINGLAPLIMENGAVGPNPMLVNSTLYQLAFDEANNDSVVNLAANGTARRTMTVDKSGVADIRKLKGDFTSTAVLLNLWDNEYQRYLMNNPVHASTIIGSGTFPYTMPIPFLMHPTQHIRAELQDISGNPNSVRFNFEGQRYYFDSEAFIFARTSYANKISRPYWYTTDDDVSLAVGNNIVTAFMTIVNEADFYLQRITTSQTGEFRVRIYNQSVGRGFTNGWVHSSVFGGTGQNYKDFEPMLLQRRTQLRFDFINMHGATNDIYITFGGTHYYYER